MQNGTVVNAKPGAGQRLLWSMVAALAVLSLVLLAYTQLIYLPAMTGDGGTVSSYVQDGTNFLRVYERPTSCKPRRSMKTRGRWWT